MRYVALILITSILAAPVLFADDVQPPSWRGKFSTTHQYWNFDDPNPGSPTAPLPPTGPGLLVDDPVGPPYEQPGYLPSTGVVVTPGPDMEWIQIDPSTERTGIWPLSGSIDIVVDNHDPENLWKIMWVQLTWRPQGSGPESVPTFTNFDPTFSTQYPPRITDEGDVDLGGGWFETTVVWRIEGNPPDEFFTIEGLIDVDQLIIDTWCIPEPASLMLLSIGGGFIIRKR